MSNNEVNNKVLSREKKTERFKRIIEENKGILYKVINIYCKDPSNKEDLEQEILLQLWRSLDNYNAEYKISTWIYRIAMNVSISFYRKNNKAPSHLSIDSIFIKNSYDEDIDEIDYKKNRLQFFIDQLNDLDKAIILLYLEEYNYKEIGKIIGITESNVGSKINRIKNKLKKVYRNGTK